MSKRVPFEFEGKQYKSKALCGVMLVNDRKMSIKDAAALLGCSYINVYVATHGKKERKKLEMKYRAIRLLKSKKHHSIAEIQRKTKLTYTEVHKLFKKVASKTKKNTKGAHTKPVKTNKTAKKIVKTSENADKKMAKKSKIVKGTKPVVSPSQPVEPINPPVAEVAAVVPAVEQAVSVPVADTTPAA